jgi:hypothetical protein
VAEVLTPKNLGGLKLEKIRHRQPFFNGLLYGDPGAGKTHLAGTSHFVPEMAPVLLIDFEGGDLTLNHVAPDIEKVRITTAKELDDVYADLARGDHDFKTVIFDSLTEFQKFDMYQIMEKVIEKYPDRDPEVPSVREWGMSLEHTRKVVRYFRDLPNINTIFTALLKTDKDNKRGSVSYKPSLPGKLADEIAGFLDFVGFVYVKEVDGENKHLVLTQKTDDTVAKDRSGKLDQVLVNATMTDIYYALTGTEPTTELPESSTASASGTEATADKVADLVS